MRGNTITMKLMRGHTCKGSLPLYQYDYGQMLILTGVSLPAAYEVHFSNTETGNSKTSIGDENGVVIPDEFLVSGSPVYVWLYLHDGESDGETEYRGMIDVYRRAKPTDQAPTPVQQSVIDQAIAALNAGISEVDEIAREIPQTIDTALQEAKDSGEFDGFSPVVTITEITGGHEVTITDADGDHEFDVLDGEKGDPGRDGVDGFSPSASVNKSGKKATISITDKDGTTTAEISDGEDGQDGSDGFSPSASVSKSGNTATISITDKDGTTSAQISDGEDGQDGATGATPIISIGTVSKLSPGSNPTASMDTTDPEHPVLSFGLVTGDPGEVTEAELQAVAEAKADVITESITTTASVQTISDGADNLPMGMTVGIEPVQDLHGQDAPYPPGGMGNIFDGLMEIGGLSTTNGGNIDQTDRTRSVNHTAVEAETQYYFVRQVAVNHVVFFYNSNKTYLSNVSLGTDNGTFTTPVNCAYIRFIVSTTDMTNMVAINYPSSITTYSPYSNICPISGWTGCNVSRTGKNIYDESTRINNYYISATGAITAENNSAYSALIRVQEGETYTFSCNTGSSSGNKRIHGYDASGNWQEQIATILTPHGTGTISVSFTIPAGCIYVRCSFAKADTEVQFEIGSTATNYEPHTGGTYPITFPSEAGTVYGGTLTVNKDGTGTLVVDKQYLTFTSVNSVNLHSSGKHYWIMKNNCNSVETTSENRGLFKANQFVSAAGVVEGNFYVTSNGVNMVAVPWSAQQGISTKEDADAWVANNPAEFCIPLATPVTYNLTDLEVIETLKGVNNVWSDTGDILELNYAADTKLYISKELDASRKLMELIITANREDEMKATKAYTTGNLLIVNGILYKATTSIANGATLTVGTNVTATTVAAEIAALS